MSKYRDDDFYSGGGGGRYERTRSGARGNEERYDSSRGDYYSRGGGGGGGGRSRDDDYERDRGDDDAATPYSRRSIGRDEEDYGRGGGSSSNSGERFDDRGGYGARYEGGGGGRPRGASRSHVRCRDIMTRDVTVATRDATLQEVAAMMRDEDTGVIPVVDREDAPVIASDAKIEETSKINNRILGNGKLVGLITDRDIVVRAIAEGKAGTTRAEEIMTTDVHTAQPNDRVIDAIRKMGDKQVRRIPIVDRDQILRGIISMADVALETEEDRELADALEEISSGSSFWNRVFG
jgi:CBS domain-containing protein